VIVNGYRIREATIGYISPQKFDYDASIVGDQVTFESPGVVEISSTPPMNLLFKDVNEAIPQSMPAIKVAPDVSRLSKFRDFVYVGCVTVRETFDLSSCNGINNWFTDACPINFNSIAPWSNHEITFSPNVSDSRATMYCGDRIAEECTVFSRWLIPTSLGNRVTEYMAIFVVKITNAVLDQGMYLRLDRRVVPVGLSGFWNDPIMVGDLWRWVAASADTLKLHLAQAVTHYVDIAYQSWIHSDTGTVEAQVEQLKLTPFKKHGLWCRMMKRPTCPDKDNDGEGLSPR